MNTLSIDELTDYVERHIGHFHHKRVERIKTLRLKDVLKRKNPYLFKAKHCTTADQIVRAIADAFISSNEETLFGDWLEGLAIFINQRVYGGRKSGIRGIDLEFDLERIRYIVTIKSGPNWGNSSQINKMIDHFNAARRILRTSGSNVQVIAVNGCCYGISTSNNQYKSKGDYFKYCGQAFWEFISGDPNLYTDLIIPLGHRAREENMTFEESYGQMINKLVRDFSNNFCDEDGAINWAKLIQFNSARKPNT
ncbi:MAG: cytosolic protein [Bacteroidetes bacterium]|nr:MAG: cytosolic protein [Bacteroidota bacterium]